MLTDTQEALPQMWINIWFPVGDSATGFLV